MTFDDEDHRSGLRIRAAIQSEARRHPLPDGFELSVAAALPDRAPVNRRPAVAVSAFVMLSAVTVALAAVVGFLLRPPASGTASPSSPIAASTSPAVPSTELIRFSSEAFSLEYPATWRVLAEDLTARHYEWIPLVVGTGTWQIPCATIAPTQGIDVGVHCGADLYTLPAGGIVVALTTFQGPAPYVQSPPPFATQLDSGLWATVLDTPTTSTWQVYVPGWLNPLTIDARFADPGTEILRAQVKRLVESLALGPYPSGS